jgi:hypothetical protein
MNKFSNLCKVKGMTTDKVMKPHYEIIYKRITQQAGTHTMNLEMFFGALELLSSQLPISEEQNVESLIEHILKCI